MNDIQFFRNKMAEKGVEWTPNEAERNMLSLDEFKDKVTENATELQHLAYLTIEEKQFLIQQFAEFGQEISLVELNNLIRFVLSV